MLELFPITDTRPLHPSEGARSLTLPGLGAVRGEEERGRGLVQDALWWAGASGSLCAGKKPGTTRYTLRASVSSPTR